MTRLTHHLNRFILASFFCLFTLFVTHPVFAQGGHTFRLMPDPDVTISSNRAYFVYESAAGSAMSDAVVVRNAGNEPIELALYAADAKTASNGGVAIGTKLGDTPQAAGTWIQLSETQISLQAGEERSIPFTVQIPEGMSPAEYGAAIVAQPADSAQDEGQSGPVGVNFIPRTAATVLLTIPGVEALQPKIEITSLRAETDTAQEIIADLRNSGNTGVEKTSGTLNIRDANGTVVQEIPLQLGYFLAGDELIYRANLDSELNAGEYDITLSLAYGDQTVEQSTRLSFGQLEEIEIVTAETETTAEVVVQPTIPTEWLIAGAAVIVSVLLLLILFVWVQLRRASRMRQANSYQ